MSISRFRRPAMVLMVSIVSLMMKVRSPSSANQSSDRAVKNEYVSFLSFKLRCSVMMPIPMHERMKNICQGERSGCRL